MPNPLTGDFDIVAQFSIPVVNRLLAAMHRIERFPHSLTVRVNDDPPPGSRFDMPTLVGVMDAYGDATSDHDRIPPPVAFPPPRGLGGFHAGVDSVVNANIAGVNLEPLTPSRLQGRAQVQISPPTMEIAHPSGSQVTVRLGLMCRYFPDPNTNPAAEFVRGELVITAPVSTAASQVANVVAIDIKANTAQISFALQWSSRPLTAEDRAGIDLVLRNALKTSFLPANITLPSNIAHAQFKTFSGASSAVAVMLDVAMHPPAGSGPVMSDALMPEVVIADGGMLDVASSDTESPAGDPATVNQVFLAGIDDFAFAVSSDFVRQSFAPALKRIRETPVEPVSFPVNGLVYTWHVTYTIALNDVAFDLETGKMVLTMRGRASTGSWTPNFDFTARQEFGLTANGATAELAVGDLKFETSSWMVNSWMWLVDLFTGRAKKSFEEMRNNALRDGNAREAVREMLNADANLGGFLRSLLSPAAGKPPLNRQPYGLAYASAEIRASGIVLHGNLSVLRWLPPRVEFEPIPASVQAGGGIHGAGGMLTRGSDYSALKSWIPGGRIQQFEWKSEGQSGAGHIDENRFVRISPPIVDLDVAESANLVSGYSPLCLTIRGTRLSSRGLVRSEAVEATVCGYNRFPIVGGAFSPDELLPTIALTRPGRDGAVEITGYATAGADATGSATPNLIVHFPDESSASRLDVIPEALRESERRDAATAILVVMDPEQIGRTRYVSGITYAPSDDGAWERRFDVSGSRGPVTIVVDAAGKVVWKQEGNLDSRTLADALSKLLVARKPVASEMGPASVRIGQPPPNFLLEHAPGQEITLRKLTGRPAVLVFWRSSSKPSIEAIHDLESATDQRARLVLAVNDGEEPSIARRSAVDAGLSATVVTDPNRRISRAYGVTIWPTIIEVDALGIVRTVRYGRDPVSDPATQSDKHNVSQRSSTS
ncbi:MAG TPA: redoxin domain-containing protein [Gemmatimonadaceae bacterium]|nr:redoxin domain-containing protein [Gemmatimonadaceae bacterium]